MGYLSQRKANLALAVLLGFLIASPVGFAKELGFQARQDLTGAQLFEHEWKSNTTSVQVLSDRAERPTEQGERPPLRTGDGLGPLHNATSCSECHLKGGSSSVKHNVTLITVDPRSHALRDKAKGGDYLLQVFPGLLGPTGTLNFTAVVHDRSTRPGYLPIRNRLANFVPEGIDERWFQPEARTSEAIADQPVVAGQHGPVSFYLSQRNAPALFGAGMIDAIHDVRIEALAKKQAAKTEGKLAVDLSANSAGADR